MGSYLAAPSPRPVRRNGGCKTTSTAFRGAFRLDNAQRTFCPRRGTRNALPGAKGAIVYEVAVIGDNENERRRPCIGRNSVFHLLPKMTTIDANWQQRVTDHG